MVSGCVNYWLARQVGQLLFPAVIGQGAVWGIYARSDDVHGLSRLGVPGFFYQLVHGLSLFPGGAALTSVVLMKVPRFGDARGWFAETFSEKRAQAAGINARFVQDNQSFSAAQGTLRGLHFQRAPHAQAKLVRCVRGSIMDYAVDIRRGSPTYGKWVGARLTAEGGEQLYVPVGFAHGFLTLEPDVEVAYKVTDFYAPDCDGGIVWNDPGIGIDWPLPESGAVLSDKDKVLPTLAEFDSPFEYDGVPLQALADA